MTQNSAWDDLKVELLRLRDQEPMPLQGYPDPRVDEGRSPPFGIRLQAWAVATAADLHSRFGQDVELTVGALRYPNPQVPEELAQALDFGAIQSAIWLEASEVVRVESGHTLRLTMQIHNYEDNEVTLVTPGDVFASVIHPSSSQVVGGFSGPHILPRVAFRVPAGGSTAVPVLLGTTSFVPELGYAVPPGEWSMAASLNLEDGRRVRTPAIPLTVT